MSPFVRLYPAVWRSRYGDELEQLLVDRRPSFGDRIDLLRGALDARLHPQIGGPRRVADRRGYAPLAGVLLFALAIVVAANGPLMRDDFGTYRDGGAALPLLIVAVLLLCVGIIAVIERLPADAGIARAAGGIAMAAAVVWSMGPWLMPVGLTFLVALLVLAVRARRSGIIGLPVEIGLVVAVAVPAGLLLATLFLPWYALRESGLNGLVVLLTLASIWILVGLVVRRGWVPEATAPIGEPGAG